jgi:serine/threonine-protein kinase
MSQRQPELPLGLRVGDEIAGKYRIDGILGAGAMGTVVAAYHLLLAERVAIKFLHPDSVGNPEASARFIREAQAAIRIKSEHVARVLDIAHLESGDLYIVMEFLEGSDLAAWLRAHGSMPARDAADYVLQACEAIAEAHALGIVHRDLKPANLFLVRPGVGSRDILKVLDFGISKTMKLAPGTLDVGDSAGGAVTGASAIMGSPFYMSPEQMGSARDVDGRSDIWALGVILCELVTGELPFTGRTLLEVYQKIMASSPAFPLSSELPGWLRAIIVRCVQRQPEDRYASIYELALALAPFGSARAQASVESIAQVLGPGAPREGERAQRERSSTSTSAPVASDATLRSQTPRPSSAAETTEPTSRPSAEGALASAPRRTAKRAVLLGLLALAMASAVLIATILTRRPPTDRPRSAALPAPTAPGPSTAPEARPRPANEALSVAIATSTPALVALAGEAGASWSAGGPSSSSASGRSPAKKGAIPALASRTSAPSLAQGADSSESAPAPRATPPPDATSAAPAPPAPPSASAASDEVLELLKQRE